MAKTGSIETFNRLLLFERTAWMQRESSPGAANLAERRVDIRNHLREVGKIGDVDLILATEKALLVNDLTLYSNSQAMQTSLGKALLELKVAEKLVVKVRDPGAYKAVDEAHSLPKNRAPKRLENSVPNDEARQFFGSQAARLLNMDKSRLDVEEKEIVDVRKQNMRTAEKAYADMQRRTLGLAPVQERGQGLSL